MNTDTTIYHSELDTRLSLSWPQAAPLDTLLRAHGFRTAVDDTAPGETSPYHQLEATVALEGRLEKPEDMRPTDAGALALASFRADCEKAWVADIAAQLKDVNGSDVSLTQLSQSGNNIGSLQLNNAENALMTLLGTRAQDPLLLAADGLVTDIFKNVSPEYLTGIEPVERHGIAMTKVGTAWGAFLLVREPQLSDRKGVWIDLDDVVKVSSVPLATAVSADGATATLSEASRLLLRDTSRHMTVNHGSTSGEQSILDPNTDDQLDILG